MKKYYLKEDVDFETLEKFDYLKWNDNKSDIKYFKFNDLDIIGIIRVFKDRYIEIQKPIGKEFLIIDIKNLIQDLLLAGLVEERDE